MNATQNNSTVNKTMGYGKGSVVIVHRASDGHSGVYTVVERCTVSPDEYWLTRGDLGHDYQGLSSWDADVVMNISRLTAK